MQGRHRVSKLGRLISTLLVVVAALTSMGMERNGPTPPTSRASDVEATSEALVTWTWDAPAYRLAPVVGDDGRTYMRVILDEYPNGRQPGKPSLPVVGRLVVLPPTGEFALDVIAVEYETISLPAPVEPAPAPADLTFDAAGRPLPGGWEFARDEALYAGHEPYPEQFVALSPPAWMRDVRLARLQIMPFRYYPDKQTLDVLRHVRLQIVPTGETKPAFIRPDSPTEAPESDAIPHSLLLNPDDLGAFRAATPLVAPIAPPTAPQAAGAYKVLVSVEGLYTLNYGMLAAAGLPVDTIVPSTLRLFHSGQEIAMQWEGDDDSIFEGDERLIFYARPMPTRYVSHDVYWLDWGGAAGRRMLSRSGDPAGQPLQTAWVDTRIEKDIEYDSRYAGWNGMHWFWEQVRQPDILSVTLDIPLLNHPRSDVPARMTPWLEGITRDWIEPDHHVRFSLNGTYIGEALWEGKEAYSDTLDIPAGLLTDVDNQLTLTLPDDLGSDIEAAWVDAITVTYGVDAVSSGLDMVRFRGEGEVGAYAIGGFTTETLHIYDVSDPSAPKVVTGWTFADGVVQVGDAGSIPSEYLIVADQLMGIPQAILAAKPYSDPPGGADYIIITHPDFQEAIAPLAARRAGQGLRVAVVDVEVLYDQFGDGRMSPMAIEEFLRYAYTTWPSPPPQYVLLVGDGSYDMRGFQPDSNPTYLPPYLADVDPWMGETSSDHQCADLTSDPLPEMWVGRLPVNTSEEVDAVVEKIIAYESNGPVGAWNRRLLFAADNPSTAGNHHEDADYDFTKYATLAYGYTGERVYLSETPGDAYLYTSAAAARSALIAALDEGVLLYTYFGHSSWHQQAVLETDGYAPLFHVSHIGDLNNQGRWPVILQMTCYTGYYIHRTDDTLDESLLRAKDVGAVAVWSSSGNGVTPDHRVLHHYFYRAIFDDGKTELGAIVEEALAGLYANGVSYDLIDTYHLFGDPAMIVQANPNLSVAIFLPVVMRGE